jgi:hypothetical protein
MMHLLRRQPHVALVTEFWPMGLRAAGTSAEEYLGRLGELQFRLYLIDERHRRLVRVAAEQLLQAFDSTRDIFGNLLCIKGAQPSPCQPPTR